MEAQLYLYIWDSRWLWAIPYPARTSFLTGACALIRLYTLFIEEQQENSKHLLGNAMFSMTVNAIALSLLIMLFIRQLGFESKRVLSFKIDEDKHKIGHYLKRREALFTWQGTLLVFLGHLRIACNLCQYFFFKDDIKALSFTGKLDLFFSFNVTITFIVWVVNNAVRIYVLMEYYPY